MSGRSVAPLSGHIHINIPRILKKGKDSGTAYRVAGVFLGRTAVLRPSQRCWTRGRKSGSDTNAVTESPRGGHTNIRMDQTAPFLAVTGRPHLLQLGGRQ